MPCAIPPHKLMRKLRISPRNVAAVFVEFGPQFGPNDITTATQSVKNAIRAAREFQRTCSRVRTAAAAAYEMADTHMAWTDDDGKLNSQFMDALLPHIAGLRALGGLRSPVTIEWDSLGKCYAQATAAATTAIAENLGPGGRPRARETGDRPVDLDTILEATEKGSGAARFGSGPTGPFAPFAPTGPAGSSGPSGPFAPTGAPPQAQQAQQAQQGLFEEQAQREQEQREQARQEQATKVQQVEAMAITDGRSERDGAGWWDKFGNSVSGAGASLTHAGTVVWSTIVKVAKIAGPPALLATLVFAVLFACCYMLGFGEYDAAAGDKSSCGFLRDLFGEGGYIGSIIKVLTPNVAGLQSSTARLQLATMYTRIMKETADNAITTNELLVGENIIQKITNSDQFLKGAFVDIGKVNIAAFKSTFNPWRVWHALTHIAQGGLTGADQPGVLQQSAGQVSPHYYKIIQLCFDNKDKDAFQLNDSTAAGKASMEMLTTYANSLNIQKIDDLLKGDHKVFVSGMHKFLWTQFTPLSGVFGRTQGGALRAIGDFIGLNESGGGGGQFAAASRATGAAIVVIAVLAGIFLGPMASASVIATAFAFYAALDLSGQPTVAVSIAVVVLNYCRMFVPTTESEDAALDKTTQLAMGLSEAVQTAVNTAKKAEIARVGAITKVAGAIPVIGPAAAAAGAVYESSLYTTPGAANRAAMLKQFTGFGGFSGVGGSGAALTTSRRKAGPKSLRPRYL